MLNISNFLCSNGRFSQARSHILCLCSPLPCNCDKKSLCSDKHVQITLLIGNVATVVAAFLKNIVAQ